MAKMTNTQGRDNINIQATVKTNKDNSKNIAETNNLFENCQPSNKIVIIASPEVQNGVNCLKSHLEETCQNIIMDTIFPESSDWPGLLVNYINNKPDIIIIGVDDTVLQKIWFGYTAGLAQYNDIPVIILTYNGLTPSALTTPFIRGNGIDLQDFKSFQQILTKINEIIKCSFPKSIDFQFVALEIQRKWGISIA